MDLHHEHVFSGVGESGGWVDAFSPIQSTRMRLLNRFAPLSAEVACSKGNLWSDCLGIYKLSSHSVPTCEGFLDQCPTCVPLQTYILKGSWTNGLLVCIYDRRWSGRGTFSVTAHTKHLSYMRTTTFIVRRPEPALTCDRSGFCLWGCSPHFLLLYSRSRICCSAVLSAVRSLSMNQRFVLKHENTSCLMNPNSVSMSVFGASGARHFAWTREGDLLSEDLHR